MSSRIRILALLFLSFASFPALAEEEAVVFLQLPPNFAATICPTPVWNQVKVQWLGTNDARLKPEVGLETKKKGKDPVAVMTSPSLASFVDEKLKVLLTQCGMNLVAAPESSAIKMSAVIQEFHAGMERGLIMGNGQAKSRLSLTAEAPHRKISASAGYQVEFKNTKKKPLERMTATLNELVLKTLEQVPASTQLRSLNEIPAAR